MSYWENTGKYQALQDACVKEMERQKPDFFLKHLDRETAVWAVFNGMMGIYYAHFNNNDNVVGAIENNRVHGFSSLESFRQLLYRVYAPQSLIRYINHFGFLNDDSLETAMDDCILFVAKMKSISNTIENGENMDKNHTNLKKRTMNDEKEKEKIPLKLSLSPFVLEEPTNNEAQAEKCENWKKNFFVLLEDIRLKRHDAIRDWLAKYPNSHIICENVKEVVYEIPQMNILENSMQSEEQSEAQSKAVEEREAEEKEVEALEKAITKKAKTKKAKTKKVIVNYRAKVIKKETEKEDDDDDFQDDDIEDDDDEDENVEHTVKNEKKSKTCLERMKADLNILQKRHQENSRRSLDNVNYNDHEFIKLTTENPPESCDLEKTADIIGCLVKQEDLSRLKFCLAIGAYVENLAGLPKKKQVEIVERACKGKRSYSTLHSDLQCFRFVRDYPLGIYYNSRTAMLASYFSVRTALSSNPAFEDAWKMQDDINDVDSFPKVTLEWILKYNVK